MVSKVHYLLGNGTIKCSELIQSVNRSALDDSGVFWTSRYQGIVKTTVSSVLEDPKFKMLKTWVDEKSDVGTPVG